MPKIGLSPYLLRIRRKRASDYLRLDHLPVGDYLDEFEKYCDLRENSYVRDTTGQRFLVVSHHERVDRVIRGLATYGDYGYRSELHDIQTGDLSHERLPTEAELVPFFFRIHIPQGGDEAILVLQRFGLRGIKGILERDLQEALRAEDDSLLIELHPLVPHEYIEHFLRDGRISEIKLTRLQLGSDISDTWDTGHQEVKARAELVLKAPRGASLPAKGRLRQVLNGQRPASRFLEIEEEYGGAKVVLSIGGRSRTIDLERPDIFRGILDVSDEVDIGDDGHPVFESVDKVAASLEDSILDNMYRG